MTDYTTRKITITGDCHAGMIRKHVRSHEGQTTENVDQRCVSLVHDNAPVHKACFPAVAIRTCGSEQHNLPPYSPDLIPNDYHLFRNSEDDEELTGAY